MGFVSIIVLFECLLAHTDFFSSQTQQNTQVKMIILGVRYYTDLSGFQQFSSTFLWVA